MCFLEVVAQNSRISMFFQVSCFTGNWNSGRSALASCEVHPAGGGGILPRRFIAFVPIPEQQVKGEQDQAASVAGAGLGSWGGVRDAPLRCPILCPGHF
jgi:hypothetical protein